MARSVARPAPTDKRSATTLAAVLLLSGFAALVYEICRVTRTVGGVIATVGR